MSDNRPRCQWCLSHPLYIDYHDQEWGVPLRNDQKLFEFLILEGAQAGLSWLTVLKKRSGYRHLFDNFDPHKIARYDECKIGKLKQDARIIRNDLKIRSTVSNAQAYLNVLESGRSFNDYLWQFVNGEVRQNRFQELKQIPAATKLSNQMSKILKKDGFKFVGGTICYAFMQATGMVNDHVESCFRYSELGGSNV